MERQALAKLGCRLIALVLVVQVVADGLVVWSRIRDLLHAAHALRDPVLLGTFLTLGVPLLVALVLAVAPSPVWRVFVGGVDSRRLRAADARTMVRALMQVAGVLILLGGVDHIVRLLSFVTGVISTHRQWPWPSVQGLDAALVIAASVAAFAGGGPLSRRFAPLEREPEATTAAGRLLGELAGAAGALGARRLTELAISIKTEAEGVAKRVMRSSIDAMISAVQQRRHDFGAASSADGTVTIAFSDMEGFTAMTQRLGDAAAHEVIKHHNQIVRRALKRHGGQEVELQGDGFLLAFPETTQALRCATAIQRACAEHSAQPDQEPIRVRIGLHRGTPIQEGDRFFGITVILAARIAGQASGAQVLVSEDVHTAVEGVDEFCFDAPREAELKGLSGRHRMHPLIWAI